VADHVQGPALKTGPFVQIPTNSTKGEGKIQEEPWQRLATPWHHAPAQAAQQPQKISPSKDGSQLQTLLAGSSNPSTQTPKLVDSHEEIGQE
jgi:hypothetical protein